MSDAFRMQKIARRQILLKQRINYN